MKILWLLAIISCLYSCVAPRTITTSGKVVPKGNLVFGAGLSGNIPTQTAECVTNAVRNTITNVVKNDTIRADEVFDKINKAAVAYSLDPINVGVDFYLRYGLFKRIDIGFKRAGGVNAFSCQYQFLGSTGYIHDDKQENNFYGSISLQYSSQKVELPSVFEDIQSRMGFNFERKDILVPLAFSYSFGSEERYGCLAFGLTYGHTWLQYATIPVNIYYINHTKIVGSSFKTDFSSFGCFINVKLGYDYVYIIPSLAIYYQDYGKYNLLSGNVSNLSGLTFVPSLGLQIRIGRSSSKD